MSSRRLWRALLAIGLLFLAAPAQAQMAGRIPRLGYLILPPIADPPSAERAAFLDGLAAMGWVPSRTIAVEYRSANWNQEMLEDLAEELIALKVDVLFAPGTQAALAAHQVSKTLPIVTVINDDPIALGLVKSLARPQSNVTGFTALGAAEMSGKRLELLRAAVPKARPIAVLWNPRNPAGVLQWRETQAAARVLGAPLQSFPVSGADDFVKAFSTISRQPPGALLTIQDTLTHSYRQIIADFSIRNRLPATMALREFAEAGGLMSYGPSFSDLFQRSATHVDKILRGVRVADLPMEQPTKYDLVINLKTAKALGLAIPPAVLVQADHVIE